MKMKSNLIACLFFAFFGLSLGASAEEPLVLELKQFLKTTQTLDASFSQRVDDGRGDFELSTGHFYLQKPDHFRWDYLEPYRQEIVSDGDKIWYFDADLEQVTVKPYKMMQGSALVLLLGKGGELEKQFDVEVVRPLQGDMKIKLIPKNEHDGVEQILVGMAAGKLSSLALKDSFGQTTTIEFDAIKQNGELKASLFNFIVPAGADLLESE